MYCKFTYEKRKELEKYVQKTITITTIAKLLGTSPATIYNELHLGINEDDGKNFSRYSADKAQETFEKKIIERLRK